MRQSSNGSMTTVASATTASSASPSGMIRMAIEVGPAVVDGNASGVTVTSITSCEPPNRVRLPGVIVVQLAVRPAGTIVYDSVPSPRLWMVSGSVSVSPGARDTSSLENQA